MTHKFVFMFDTAEIQVSRNCGVTRCHPGWGRDRQTSLHLLDHELWLVIAGRGEMSDGSQTRALRRGFCVWMRPGGIYDASMSERHPLTVIWIHFTVTRPKRFSPSWEYQQIDGLDAIRFQAQRVVSLMHAPASDAARAPQRLAALQLGALLADLSFRATAPAAPVMTPLEQSILQIAREMRDRPEVESSIESMAQRVGYSRSYFTAAFTKLIGESPQAYRVRHRIEKARVLLRESNLSVASIADALGYQDVFFFSRQFKQCEGVSPNRFRAVDVGSV